MLNEIADFFRRDMGDVDTAALLPLEETRRQGLGRLLGLLVRAVERKQRPRYGGARGGELAHLRGQHVLSFEERIGQGLEESRDQPSVFVAGKRVQLDSEELCQANEQRGGQGPIV